MSGLTGPSRRGMSRQAATLVAWSSLLLVLVLGLASCAKPPEAELAAAQAAIDQAKANEASEYAPNELRAAQDSLAAAQAEIDKQKSKFALLRSYKTATRIALNAGDAGTKAGEAAVQNKEIARQEAESSLAEAVQTIADARGLLESPEGKRLMRAKEAREALTQIMTELDATEAALENIREAMANQKFKVAQRMGKESLAKAQGLRGEIEDAISGMTGKK